MTQIRKKLKFSKPESPFDKYLEEEFLSAWLELAAALNKGINFDNFEETWEDYRIAGLSAKLGATAPDLVAFGPAGNLLAYGFNGDATSEQCYFSIQMPHNWKTATGIRPHVHWAPSSSANGAVKWFLEYSWASIDAAFGNAQTISVVDAADGTAWKHQMAPLAEISGTGKGLSSMLMCRLYRNPADGQDTYEADAIFLEFDIHYQIDSLGSREEYVK